MAACTNDYADGNGLTDVYEMLASQTDPNDPDTDNDGRSDYEELVEELADILNDASFTRVRLGYFPFNDTNWRCQVCAALISIRLSKRLV